MVLRLATCSDTGTVIVGCSGTIIDLGRAWKFTGATGGLLDATVHPPTSGPKQYRSVGVAIPLEISLLASGKQVYVSAIHRTRSSTAGAGSTWATVLTDEKRFKQGTSTAATYHHGFVSSINTQAVKRYYRCNIKFAFRKASSTSAKDTTTAEKIVCNSPVYLFAGGDHDPIQGV